MSGGVWVDGRAGRLGASLRVAVLVVAALFFAVPLVATFAFSLFEGQGLYGLSAYAALFERAALIRPLLLSFELAAATIVVILLVMVSAAIAVHLFAPRLRVFLEVAAVLPFVIPAIAMVAGLTALIHGPGWLVGSPFYLVLPYVFLALPYAYRAIDVALLALDLPSLGRAAASLGAGKGQTILWVVLPNLRPALVNAALMTFTVVLGEFTVANVLLFETFPVSINLVGKSEPTQAAALSVVSFLLTWAALYGVLKAGRRRAPSRPEEAKS